MTNTSHGLHMSESQNDSDIMTLGLGHDVNERVFVYLGVIS